MVKYYEDKEYLSIIDEIIKNDEFKKMARIKHHNTTRMNHLIKVSFRSYKIAKHFDQNGDGHNAITIIVTIYKYLLLFIDSASHYFHALIDIFECMTHSEIIFVNWCDEFLIFVFVDLIIL